VVAIGGNALADPHDPAALQHQGEKAESLAGALAAALVDGAHLIIVHGNGPQVGARLIQNDAARREVPESPLHVCVAETQGQIGHYLAHALRRRLDKLRNDTPIACLITHVVVDSNAPEFARPDKPVGPTYTADRAVAVRATHEWQLAAVPGGGFRRVVPSPRPLEVIESTAVARLVADGFCVIAGGGGGVPVSTRAQGSRPLDAVVDKDYTAQLLASGTGAERLIILTDVPGVALSFGKTGERYLKSMRAQDARSHLQRGEFAAGSMAPKVEACLDFLTGGGRDAIIAHHADAAKALRGAAGTRVTP
jgi:carbamate kinase